MQFPLPKGNVSVTILSASTFKWKWFWLSIFKKSLILIIKIEKGGSVKQKSIKTYKKRQT